MKKFKVLYGGSVNPKNINNINQISELNGFLVGGASQDPKGARPSTGHAREKSQDRTQTSGGGGVDHTMELSGGDPHAHHRASTACG